ncbi:MAG: CAP domain-containing protein [Desulfobulbaceae bacterium]|nr:CAP domain-containing protein [Desulfobulbaceae bacterium]HIJ89314.1 hypothetical protein [Deltaproteobacteria bacterium]
MNTSIRTNILFILLLAAITALLPARVMAATTLSAPQAITAPRADLSEQGYLLWQRFNEARANPRAVMARLGIPEATVRGVLGQDGWLLDQGLPPLAWNEQIRSAANGHGRDMLDNLFYSHLSPDGRTLAARLNAAGYDSLLEAETLSALVFNNPVAMTAAVEAICDNMLRDELSGTPGVARNIFSPNFSEVGLALLAENVPLLAGQPYVYLMVADFSQPMEARNFVVGQIATGTKLVLRSRATGLWDDVPVLPGNCFQFRLSGLGEELFYWVGSTPDYVKTASTVGIALGRNQILNLR